MELLQSCTKPSILHNLIYTLLSCACITQISASYSLSIYLYKLTLIDGHAFPCLHIYGYICIIKYFVLSLAAVFIQIITPDMTSACTVLVTILHFFHICLVLNHLERYLIHQMTFSKMANQYITKYLNTSKIKCLTQLSYTLTFSHILDHTLMEGTYIIQKSTLVFSRFYGYLQMCHTFPCISLFSIPEM